MQKGKDYQTHWIVTLKSFMKHFELVVIYLVL